jgi:hypothetical protein
LTVIEPETESPPVLVIPIFKLASIYGFQGPVRSAAPGTPATGLSKLNSVRHAGLSREADARVQARSTC